VREVALVGDFGGWNIRYQMEQVAPGVWSTAVPLEPGVYDYAFVVDGTTWLLDPLAPAVADGFGGANSRLSVLPPDVRTRT
jgi:1,4-alpha-glucan branching enzyme